MRHAVSSLGNFEATFFDEDVYVQERNLIYVHMRVRNRLELRYTIYTTTPKYGVVYYTPDENNNIVIDVTELLRTNAPLIQRGNIYLSWNTQASGDSLNVSFHIAGLINPANVLIPANADAERVREELEVEGVEAWSAPILLPSMILQDIGVYGARLFVELYPTNAESPYNDYTIRTDDDAWKAVQRANEIPINKRHIRTYNADYNRTLQDVEIKPLNPCARYAAVRWVSFTGVTRVHTFEVHDVTQSTDEVIKLETLDGSYNQIKGRTDGFKLYLDELDTYDFWYYADVINSSKVEVTLDGETWEQVEVTTKSVTIPNSDQGALNKLEINVNWRQYDAVTM